MRHRTMTAPLVAPRVALTAGHCFGGANGAEIAPPEPLNFYIFNAAGAVAQSAVVDRIKIISSANGVWDLALLRLATPITAATPIAISASVLADNASVVSLGFGCDGTAGPAGIKRGKQAVLSRLGLSGTDQLATQQHLGNCRGLAVCR